jgi:hypothetical protein
MFHFDRRLINSVLPVSVCQHTVHYTPMWQVSVLARAALRATHTLVVGLASLVCEGQPFHAVALMDPPLHRFIISPNVELLRRHWQSYVLRHVITGQIRILCSKRPVVLRACVGIPSGSQTRHTSSLSNAGIANAAA